MCIERLPVFGNMYTICPTIKCCLCVRRLQVQESHMRKEVGVREEIFRGIDNDLNLIFTFEDAECSVSE